MDNRQLHKDESIYRAQISEGFASLQFDVSLELAFRQLRARENLKQLRITLGLLWIFELLLFITEYYSSNGFSSYLVPLRTFVSESLLLLMLVTSYRNIGQRWLEPMGMLLGLNFGLVALLTNAYLGAQQGLMAPVTPYVTATFFIYFCFGLRFWQAVIISGLLFVGFGTATLVSVEGVTTSSLYAVLFLLFPNLVGALGAYNLEYNQRQRFLMEWELKYQANHDQLTGLWNRRALQEHAVRAWAHCNREQQPLSLALIDIDYFKLYNDTYGHIKGDQCLAEFARLLRSAAQRPLDMVSRYGGEEFAVLLPNCGAEQAERLMQQVREELEEHHIPHRTSKIADRLTVSIGIITVVPKQATLEFNRLLNSADKALYDAKARGRNVIVAREERLVDVSRQKVETLPLRRVV